MPVVTHDRGTFSSAELPVYNPDRAEEIQHRHELLAEYLTLKGLDALLLQDASNIAWLSCGADVHRTSSLETVASLFITKDARVVLCKNTDSQQLFDGAFSGMGFQLKERPWHEDRKQLFRDLTAGRQVGCDIPYPDTVLVEEDLLTFRTQLGKTEDKLLRDLGRDVAHAVEATARNCPRNAPEAEVAGQVSHRLIHHQVTPLRIQVMADGRGERYRHWSFSDSPIRRFATISAIGRRHGLHVGVSRTFCFGELPPALVKEHQHASLLLATGMYFSQAGWATSETFKRVQRIYEKFGAPDEWRLADQGEVIGYGLCEWPITHEARQNLALEQCLFWHPSVGQAAVGDTMQIRERGFKLLTVPMNWPMLSVQVKGTAIELPTILRRDTQDEWAI